MEWFFEPLPAAPAIVLGVLLTVTILILALTRLRGTRLALLVAANIAIFLLWMPILRLFDASPWRLQVVLERLVELPLVCGLAAVCFVQSYRLKPSEQRLHQALRSAPWLLVGAWIVAFVAEQVWPQPSLNYFAAMPVRNWGLLTFLCVPFLCYIWLLTFLFARAAGSRTPTLLLRAQNLFLAAAIGGYGLSSVNVLAGYAVKTFLANPLRRDVTVAQFFIEERLFLLWAPAMLMGLLLAALPSASRVARTTDVFHLLALREHFEGLAWRLEAAGALRRLTRPLHHLTTAAADLGLPKAEAAKAAQAVKLAAVIGAPRAPAGLSRERACELLERLEGAGEPTATPTVPWVNDATHLPEALGAALNLSASAPAPENPHRPIWFELARAACIDAGITRADGPKTPTYLRVSDAYRKAANLVRGT